MSAPIPHSPFPDHRVQILRTTAHRLASGAPYRWTHLGQCNCGHLAQTVSQREAADIHQTATRAEGDWRDQILAHEAERGARPRSGDNPLQEVDLCPTTNRPLDEVIESLVAHGFSHSDLAHLERLSSPEILRSFLAHDRQFDHRVRGDVVRYMRRWADLIEAKEALTLTA